MFDTVLHTACQQDRPDDPVLIEVDSRVIRDLVLIVACMAIQIATGASTQAKGDFTSLGYQSAHNASPGSSMEASNA